MAHNIQILANGDACFVENGKKERAWHNLGTVYDRPMTAIEAIKGAHADFDVEAKDMFYMTPELRALIEKGNDISVNDLRDFLRKVDNRMVTVRTDTYDNLGVVSDSYGIVQNQHAFDFVDMMTTGELGGETPTIECAGVLGKGERIFITAKFPEPIIVGNNTNDVIDMYIVFTTSHDGSGAVCAMVTPVRVVCNNTLNYALEHNSGKLSLRHSAHVMTRLDLTNEVNAKLAYKTLNLYDVYKKEFKEKLDALAQVRMNDKEIEKVLVKSLLSDDHFLTYKAHGYKLDVDDIPTRSKNIIENVTASLHRGIGQDNLAAGTGLWLVNGLTTYYQNKAKWTDETKKFDSIMNGNVQAKLQNAINALAA